MGCIFPVVIEFEFRMGQYWDHHHQEDASHFSFPGPFKKLTYSISSSILIKNYRTLKIFNADLWLVTWWCSCSFKYVTTPKIGLTWSFSVEIGHLRPKNTCQFLENSSIVSFFVILFFHPNSIQPTLRSFFSLKFFSVEFWKFFLWKKFTV